MKDRDLLQSKVIDFLRFPMIVGIVLLHSYLETIGGIDIPQNGIPVYHWLSFFISKVLAQIAVPLFFFISGYLFFYRVTFSCAIYTTKLRSKMKTLLMPYLFWNMVVLAGYWGIALFSPVELTSGAYKSVVDYTFYDYLLAFWKVNGTMPINGVLWFIRDLMIVVLFSPLLYWALRYLRWMGLLLGGGMWILGVHSSIPSMTAIFFFSLGAWFSINSRNFVADFKPFFPYGFILYLLFAIGTVGMRESQSFDYISRVGILLGVVAVIALVTYYVEKGSWKSSAFLTGSCFLVYAFHQLPLNIVERIMSKAMHPIQDWQFILMYFIGPLIIIMMDLLVYALLSKYSPHFVAFITGNRNRR